jgi:uncharacterized protein (DUF362 family)
MRKIALVLFCAIASSGLAQTIQPSPTPSTVYAVHDPNSIKDYKTNPRVVRGMVNRLVLAATGQSNMAKAWASLVSPQDRIGIKISAAGGELFTTHHDVVNAIVDGLVVAGHSRNEIIVWDRSLGGIKDAGYRVGIDGYQLRAITPRDGYDPKAVLTAPLAGQLIWGDLDYLSDARKMLSDVENSSNVSHLSKILSSDVTKIINVPVMSISETNGIAGCIYNVTIQNIDNWRRFAQGSRLGGESLAEIYANPLIAKKVVFNLMDGLIAQHAGGPQSQPNYATHHATLYASKDAVALDAIALKRLEEWRARASLPKIGRLAAYIDFASQLGLGNSAPNRIEVRNIIVKAAEDRRTPRRRRMACVEFSATFWSAVLLCRFSGAAVCKANIAGLAAAEWNERAIPFANNNSALRLAFVLSFDPIFAGAITRTGCLGISACTGNRHRRRHDRDCQWRADRNSQAAVKRDSGKSFARRRCRSNCRICPATDEQERTTTA